MRLLVTTDTVGGVWTYTVELAHALAPHGVQVHVATLGRPRSAAQVVESGVFASVAELDVPLEWMPDPWAGVDAAGAWLLDLEERLRPDVVHLGGYAHAALPWRAPTVVVAHSDVLSWWRAVHGERAPTAWDEYARRVSAGLTAAGRVVAPTAAVASDLRREYGYAGVVVVPNCRRAALFPAGRKEPLVLAAGRVWDPAKGLTDLGALVDLGGPADLGGLGVPVVVAGEGAGDGEDGVAGVQSLGPLATPDLAQWMRRAAVFVAPARYEPFGLAALEAALAGCALVLGDLPSLREVWGEAAWYVRDREELRAAVVAALADPSRGAVARARAVTYAPERTAAAMLAVYDALPARCVR